MAPRPYGKRNLLGENNVKGFGQITRKYIGKSFDECNCLALLYNIFTAAGIDVPDNYKGYTLGTYMPYWEKTPEKAIKDMIELFKTLGKEVDIRFLKRGDAVVVKYKRVKFPAIYIGGSNIMAVTKEQGVIVTSLGSRFQLVMARRLI